jgi:uncharacterized protein YkwD
MQKHLAKIIFGLLVLVGGLSSCDSSLSNGQSLPSESAPSSRVSQESNKSKSEFAALEESVHQQVNQYRQSRGLPPLKLDARISEQSRVHSEAMASGEVPFSHNGFEGRVKAIAKDIPYRQAAENVAYNMGYSNPGEQAVEGWINSPGHRKNMEGNYDFTGIGITKNAKGEYYLTQVFIKRR